MSYNSSTKIITAPVSIYDVQRCFGLGSPDLATLILTANINMWSGIKPIYSTKIAQLTSQDRANPRTLSGYKVGGGVKKWANTFANYQVNMGSYGNPASQLWALDRPVLDGSCVFRLTDFSGYWHTAQNMFTIYSYITNLSNIPIPSATGGDGGVDIDFMIYTNVISGCILADELFGDCLDFYPAVIMTCSTFIPNTNPSVRCHFVKSASQTLRSLLSQQNINATVRVNTSEFAAAVATDMGGGNTPYQNAPLISGTQWTSCVALVSREFTGGTAAGNHRFNASDTIIRLEYATDIDRWVLPIAQGKYTIVDWIKMNVTITRQTSMESGNKVYKITNIRIVTKKKTAADLIFNKKAQAQCYIGSVTIGGVTPPSSDTWMDFGGNTTVQGASGAEVGQDLANVPETIYRVTGTSAGNAMCNGKMKLIYTSGNNVYEFSGGFSFDVSAGSGSYSSGLVTLI